MNSNVVPHQVTSTFDDVWQDCRRKSMTPYQIGQTCYRDGDSTRGLTLDGLYGFCDAMANEVRDQRVYGRRRVADAGDLEAHEIKVGGTD